MMNAQAIDPNTGQSNQGGSGVTPRLLPTTSISHASYSEWSLSKGAFFDTFFARYGVSLTRFEASLTSHS